MRSSVKRLKLNSKCTSLCVTLNIPSGWGGVRNGRFWNDQVKPGSRCCGVTWNRKCILETLKYPTAKKNCRIGKNCSHLMSEIGRQFKKMLPWRFFLPKRVIPDIKSQRCTYVFLFLCLCAIYDCKVYFSQVFFFVVKLQHLYLYALFEWRQAIDTSTYVKKIFIWDVFFHMSIWAYYPKHLNDRNMKSICGRKYSTCYNLTNFMSHNSSKWQGYGINTSMPQTQNKSLLQFIKRPLNSWKKFLRKYTHTNLLRKHEL